jgi:ankyrin repeat protein
MLAEETVRATTFAEDVIRGLAQALGIDRNLAIADYRDEASDDGSSGMGGRDDDDDDDDGGPSVSGVRAGLMARLASQFGFHPGNATADPQVTALVQAAARGDTDEIDRLLADGVAINGEAPAPLPGGKLMPGLAQLIPGGIPQIPMTPLLAAVANRQRAAVERLLRGGADPHLLHSQFGTPLHAATGAGDVELVQLLIEHGADANARNAQGQTPLQMLAVSRTAMDRLVQMQATLKSMGMKLPEQLSKVSLPREGWDACERLLKAHGAQ